ncbi:hypothetical protein BGX24_008903 [Mortierella sp. AD032]|nr:hypothetical protein BGX24_008903 [Mortierella sp. AD032]
MSPNFRSHRVPLEVAAENNRYNMLNGHPSRYESKNLPLDNNSNNNINNNDINMLGNIYDNDTINNNNENNMHDGIKPPEKLPVGAISIAVHFSDRISNPPLEITIFAQARTQFRTKKDLQIVLNVPREQEFTMTLDLIQRQVDIYLQHYTCQTESQLNRLLRSCFVQFQRQSRPRHQLEPFLYGHSRHQKYRSHLRQQKQRLRCITSKRLLHFTPIPTATTGVTTSTTSKATSIFRLPYEILCLIPPHVSNPKDLLSLSHTCKAFQELCDEQLWFSLHIRQVSHWSADTEFRHLGQGSSLQPWRQVVLDDYFRNLDSFSSEALIKSSWKIELCHSANILPAHLGPVTNIPFLSSPHPLTGAQTKPIKLMWRNTGPPVSYTDPLTQFTITAYLQAQSTLDASSGEQTVYQVVLYNLHDHNTPLAIIPGSLWSDSNRTNLQRPANPRSLIGQLMDIRRFSHQKDILGRTRILFVMAFGERVPANVTQPERGPGEIEMELLDIWTQGKIVEVYIYDSPQGALLQPSKTEQSPTAPYWGRVQHIDPSPQHPTLIRGRAIKLYSIWDSQSEQVQDRVALFGIHHDGHSSNIVMLTGPVFPASAPSSSPYTDATGNSLSSSVEVPMTIRHVKNTRLHTPWSPCFFGSPDVSETTSMTLFPAHSDFEHLLVIVDRRGHGEIWDWINSLKVASLSVARDSRIDAHPTLRQNLYFWGVQVNWTVEEPTSTISSGQGKRNDVDRQRCFFRKHGDFRIIALADGQESEWETIRWDIKGDDLVLQQEGDDSKAGWEVESKSRHYEACTMGESHISPIEKSVGATDDAYKQQQQQFDTPATSATSATTTTTTTTAPTPNIHPLLFVAFLIWDHYRISLTSKFGLCLFDMNKELPEDKMAQDETHPSMWVTELEDSAQNPLLDIATAGDYLILTRRYSHVLWPFRKVVSLSV